LPHSSADISELGGSVVERASQSSQLAPLSRYAAPLRVAAKDIRLAHSKSRRDRAN
jgi:hypothetical protein